MSKKRLLEWALQHKGLESMLPPIAFVTIGPMPPGTALLRLSHYNTSNRCSLGMQMTKKRNLLEGALQRKSPKSMLPPIAFVTISAMP